MRTASKAFCCVVSSFAATSLACGAGVAFAQFSISRFTVDGGGGDSRGGAFALDGTAGQPDAGRLEGGSFVLSGGFWGGGGGVAMGLPDDGTDLTASSVRFHVFPASPNPVRETMALAFDLPAASVLRAEVYDVAGRLVRVLANELVPPGRTQRAWDCRDQRGNRVPAGNYLIRLDTGAHRNCQKVVVVY
jgi:hypothetical protein